MTEEDDGGQSAPKRARSDGQKARRKKFFDGQKRQKRPKVMLTFDTDDRKSFLTGFQKRKAERKLKAKHVLDEELREERLRAKQRQKDRLLKLYDSQRPTADIEAMALPAEATETYELPKQFVSITTFDPKDMSGSLGLSLGHNTDNSGGEQSAVTTSGGHQSDNSEDDSSDSEAKSTARSASELRQQILDARKANKMEALKSLKTNKAYQRREKEKHRKDVSSAKQKRKEMRKEMKNMKQKTLLKRQMKNKKINKSRERRRRRPKPKKNK
ncbi:unnamed protein product [Medioppia subpectinata]|uniref:Nucleolar protein 12 n=1 Tax=Medioppia subpectinata TaxID=1979941 RepID=A0A7R9KJB1_9ACAR|nr:unnamed protein product [Medioppia subpectinata]CAG2104445.1 unnamed protein product [Medioppia subpectinata]